MTSPTLDTQRLTTITWATLINQIITKCHPGAWLPDHLQGRELISENLLSILYPKRNIQEIKQDVPALKSLQSGQYDKINEQ